MDNTQYVNLPRGWKPNCYATVVELLKDSSRVFFNYEPGRAWGATWMIGTDEQYTATVRE